MLMPYPERHTLMHKWLLLPQTPMLKEILRQ